jgi:hypothetical protein
MRLDMGAQMIGFSGVTVMLLATLGGAWGWRVGTKRLYRRTIFDDGDEQTARRWRQRAAERYLLTLLYAASVAAGAAVVIAVMSHR